ncbi:Uncharacterised protein (plasmid) [Tsukamurella tyrosinosolvens]|uniref:Uncharacterized protein n=1 Tax=Tsukamurella tyrosinosolvens TaxID=57704 RepID=A0A1H4L5P5_TSUTY|nr:hypothetical protein [Tsukamurella tyrosinosolvens]KXO96506.1 hypothetical protein AXK58_04205 [Tsukamurella tyrosinosolvens]SEB65796.1 hypothetical protein SAMN04489793_0459 [Tsukamurella tyrosinosolvens]VEH93260.1 Uncharacterised protein [Tsukamurella tyrosinosolvens]
MDDHWYSSAYPAASMGTYDNFIAVYEGSEDEASIQNHTEPKDNTLLWKAAHNRNVDARLAICNRLIDDGIDVAYEDNKTNVLHLYFSNRTFEPEKEAPLLRRLLEGGADLNLQPSKGYSPLMTFMTNPRLLPDEVKVPFFNVLLEFPEFVYREPDGSLRWPMIPSLTACIEAHEAKAGGR